MKPFRHSKNGFTFTELLVATSVSVVVVVFSAQLLITMVRVEAKSTSNFTMDTESVRFLSTFARDTQSARVALTASADQIELNIPRFGGETETIRYRFVQPDPNEESYKLMRREIDDDGNGSDVEFVDHIIDYELKFFDSSRSETNKLNQIRFIQLYMQLAQTIGGKTHSRELVTPFVMLRNQTVAN